MLGRLALLALVSSFSAGSALAAPPPPPIHILADLTDTKHKLFHAEIDLPVKPGPVTLTTPLWIPGSHSPNGPVNNIVGVVFTVQGRTGAVETLPWRRDDLHLAEYHVAVPAGVTTLHVHLDAVTYRLTSTWTTLEWESLMMYPAGLPVREIPIRATVKVPAGWGLGTSLRPTGPQPPDPQHPTGGTFDFEPVTVETLEDSPIMAGRYFHEYALAADITPKHVIDVISAKAGDQELRPEVVTQLSTLVHEAFAMYGPPHYTSYHFLLLLSTRRGGGGLEHHESSNNSLNAKMLSTREAEVAVADLLPHEFTHSWNGKYRRPAGLATPDFATPMQGRLLWVYEGLTDYLGNVMAARTGVTTAAEMRDHFAVAAAEMDATSGRAWRSTEDTAVSVSILRGGGGSGWSNWRRASDYYPEGDLLWLDVDTTIRKLTHEQKSLHDFLLLFFEKGGTGVARVVPYDFTELTADLNQVAAFDWAGFLHDRVSRVDPRVDLGGIEQGGYKLIYRETPGELVKLSLERGNTDDEFLFSLGLMLDAGAVEDVCMGGVAERAGLAPGQKIVAVDGAVFTTDALHAALKAAKANSQPIALLVQGEDDSVASLMLDYHEGDRYPVLVRVDGVPDRLDEIAKPLTIASK